jgi:class 3 adenylate cyclase
MAHRILVVDDEPDLEILVMQRFRSRVRNGELIFDFAENGLKALEKLAADATIDLILSDINMPQMDGLTLLDKIRENNHTQKTVMISAYGDMDNIRTAMNRGAFDFILKPIDFIDFETTLNKAIEETVKMKEARENKKHLENERKEKEELILNQNKMLEQKVVARTEQLMAEKKKSDDLLLNILPEAVATELKQTGQCQPKTFSMVTVMFTDFKDFTSVSEKVSGELLVNEINYCFSAFDDILQKHRIEKIKTIGDAYMCASGLPTLSYTHAFDMVKAALEMKNFMLWHKKEKEDRGEIAFEIRIGIHTGPVVAGIVGTKKFSYDIWGDTVNLAARMESSGEAGQVNISGSTYALVKDKFNCTHRGKIQAKNKGEIDMYFVSE